MSDKEIYNCLKGIGCCDLCILRHLGTKSPEYYADPGNAFQKLGIAINDSDSLVDQDVASDVLRQDDGNDDDSSENQGPARKKARLETCPSCLGVLQKNLWAQTLDKAKEELQRRGYGCVKFACSLSAPTSILLREYSMKLFLQGKFPNWQYDHVTSIKEAWKWSFGPQLAEVLGMTLESGAVCPFLVNVALDHDQHMEELQTLRLMTPASFTERERCHRKFRGETFTRKGVEGMLLGLHDEDFTPHFAVPPPIPLNPVTCSAVTCSHESIYIAGRYTKFSRELCQTPWVLDGKRMMESSTQDIIFEPLIKFFKIPSEVLASRLKFMSSGREDVDVRCLGKGRPFAVEVVDPCPAAPSLATLASLQQDMSKSGDLVRVTDLQTVNREELTILKQGEETKTKTYLALCVKLRESKTSKRNIVSIDSNIKEESLSNVEYSQKDEKTLENCKNKNGSNDNLNTTLNENGLIVNTDSVSRTNGSQCELSSVAFTVEDLEKINGYTNVPGGSGVVIQQKTPLRVLHRRPLLVRQRKILSMEAAAIEGKPNLFTVRMTTEAGTYIKEFVHGDFSRTQPNLGTILGCRTDILALDVESINLDWPKDLSQDLQQESSS